MNGLSLLFVNRKTKTSVENTFPSPATCKKFFGLDFQTHNDIGIFQYKGSKQVSSISEESCISIGINVFIGAYFWDMRLFFVRLVYK